MDLYFNLKKKELKKRVREFVENELSREFVREFDQLDEFPHELLKKLTDYDLVRINVPKKYGGMGGDIIDLMLVFEEIAKRLPVLCWALGNIILYGSEIIGVNGSQEQKEKYLPKLAKGELTFSFAITEPNAGSDAASIKTKAVYENGHYVINGNKMFISGAGVTDFTTTFVRTSESRYGGLTAFIVDTKLEGYAAKPIKKIGHHGSNTCEVHYDNVKVLPQDILGGEGGLNQGWQQEMKLLNQERLVLSACALGIGQAALDDALEFVKPRLRSGQSTGVSQSISHRLAEMATEMEAARQLAYSTAWKVTQHMECVKETSMTKFYAAETAKKVILEGINLLGQYGSVMERDMQRYLRDVLILSIGGGTTQIQKNIIAKTLGL